MNNSKAKYWVGAVVVILILGVIYWIYNASGSSDAQNATTNTNSADIAAFAGEPVPSADAAMSDASATNTTPAAGAPGSGAARLTYTEALKKYASSRIQLDTSCQAVPNVTTYKAGTTIMFDNRAAVARKIMYNLKTYTIPAYDYLLLPATAPKYPAITFVDCGDKQNVATITIQK